LKNTNLYRFYERKKLIYIAKIPIFFMLQKKPTSLPIYTPGKPTCISSRRENETPLIFSTERKMYPLPLAATKSNVSPKNMTFHALLSINQIDKTKINRQDL
jgi:hypothetical protein